MNYKIKKETEKFFGYGQNLLLYILKENQKIITEIYLLNSKKDNNIFLEKIKKLTSKKDKKIKFVSEKFFNKYVDKKIKHQDVIFLVNFKYGDFNNWKNTLNEKQNHFVLILDKIEDPHNFGAISRTAAAFGASAIFIAQDKQVGVNNTVLKTSASNVLKNKIIKVSNINNTIKELKKIGFWIYGLDSNCKKKESIMSQNFDKKTAFVIGSEGDGISKKNLENCDFITFIPMENDVESLNVSVATAIAVFQWKSLHKSKNSL